MYFHFFSTGRSSHLIHKAYLIPSVWSVPLENIHLKGHLAKTLLPNPLFLQDSGNT